MNRLDLKELIKEIVKEHLNPEKDYQIVQKYSKNDQLKWCQRLWGYYNKTLFGNKLPNGGIRFTKNTGAAFKTRGNYHPRSNTIGLNDHLFNAVFDKFKNVFLHEMCHQATFKISNKEREGHGPTWMSWMRKVGLSPSRLDTEENDTYLAPEELKKKQEKEKTKEKAIQKQIPIYPQANKFARWFDKNNNKWIIGMIVKPNDQARKRWIFINNVYGSGYTAVPANWFYELTNEDLKILYPDIKKFEEKANRISGYKDEKDSRRRENSSMKKYWRTRF